MNKEILGQKLRELRLAHGYTQKDIAEMLGRGNSSTIGSWEIGKSEPDLSTFARLMRIYNISDIAEVFPELSSDNKKAPSLEEREEAFRCEIKLLIGREPSQEDIERIKNLIRAMYL